MRRVKRVHARLRRAMVPLRRSGTHPHLMDPDQQRITPQVGGAAPHPGNARRMVSPPLLHHPRPRRLKGMIDQRRHGLERSARCGPTSRQLERGFIDPARVDVEQPGIPGRGKGVDRKAAGFGAGSRASTSCSADAASASLPSWTWKRAKMKNGIGSSRRRACRRPNPSLERSEAIQGRSEARIFVAESVIGRAFARPVGSNPRYGLAGQNEPSTSYFLLQNVDGQDKPGHDECVADVMCRRAEPCPYSPVNPAFTGSTLPSSSRK